MALFERGLRKDLIIDRPSQMRIIVAGIKFAVIMAFVNIVSLYILFGQIMKKINNFGQINSDFYTSLLNTLHLVVAVSIVLTAIVVTLTITFGVLLSNKIAGPIYKLKTAVEKTLAGERDQKVSFRADDFFQELPPLINQLLKEHHAKKD